MVGKRLGPYEVLSAIGAGGMGEVYRARDTRLERDVAIKILPGLFATDPERLARFEREAKTLASLSHPHIAQIYGLEALEDSNARALVMELVDGEDLSARIARGAMPAADALPMALQIADALEAAHERGIIHRDLKPANIRVTADGAVKVLDFGLAKAIEVSDAESDQRNSPTMSIAGTRAGMVLPEIVSPENACFPYSISKSTTPNAQMSARRSTACPRACSGTMYDAVPNSIRGSFQARRAAGIRSFRRTAGPWRSSRSIN